MTAPAAVKTVDSSVPAVSAAPTKAAPTMETCIFFNFMNDAERVYFRFAEASEVEKNDMKQSLDRAYEQVVALSRNNELPKGISGQDFARLLFLQARAVQSTNKGGATLFIKASILYQIVDNYTSGFTAKVAHALDSGVSELLPDDFRKDLLSSKPGLSSLHDNLNTRNNSGTFPNLNKWLLANTTKGIHITGDDAQETSTRLADSLNLLNQCYKEINAGPSDTVNAVSAAITEISGKLVKPFQTTTAPKVDPKTDAKKPDAPGGDQSKKDASSATSTTSKEKQAEPPKAAVTATTDKPKTETPATTVTATDPTKSAAAATSDKQKTETPATTAAATEPPKAAAAAKAKVANTFTQSGMFRAQMEEAERVFARFGEATTAEKATMQKALDDAYTIMTGLAKRKSALPKGITGQQVARLLFLQSKLLATDNPLSAGLCLKSSIIFQIVDNYTSSMSAKIAHALDSSVSDLMPDEFRKDLITSASLKVLITFLVTRNSNGTFPNLNKWLQDNSTKGIHITGDGAKEISAKLAESLELLGQNYKDTIKAPSEADKKLFTAISDICRKLVKEPTSPKVDAKSDPKKDDATKSDAKKADATPTAAATPKPTEPATTATAATNTPPPQTTAAPKSTAAPITIDQKQPITTASEPVTPPKTAPSAPVTSLATDHKVTSTWKELGVALLVVVAVSAVFIAIGIAAKAPLLIASGAMSLGSGIYLLARWHFTDQGLNTQVHYGFAAAYPTALSIAATACTFLTPIPAAVIGILGLAATGGAIYKGESATLPVSTKV